MANKFILKRSSVADKAPLVSDLEYGELAINYHDGKLYYKRSDNLIDEFTSPYSETTTITKSLTLTNDWQDTGISATDLATGTYVVQLYANDGINVNEYYSGVMSWYSGNTQSSSVMPTDEVYLHRAGGSEDGIEIYLRTYRTPSGGADLKLQIYSNHIFASNSNYVFKFRRMI